MLVLLPDTFKSSLAAPVGSTDTLLKLRPDLQAEVCTALAGGICGNTSEPTHTYLYVTEGDRLCEYVRVLLCSGGGLAVERAQFGTIARSFTRNACASWVWNRQIVDEWDSDQCRLCGEPSGISLGCAPTTWRVGNFEFGQTATGCITRDPVDNPTTPGVYANPTLTVDQDGVIRVTNTTSVGVQTIVGANGITASGVANVTVGLTPVISPMTLPGGAQVNQFGQLVNVPPNWPSAAPLLPDGIYSSPQIVVSGGYITGLAGVGGGGLQVTGLAPVVVTGTGPYQVALAPSGVTPGAYCGLTVDQFGRVTDVVSGWCPVTSVTAGPGLIVTTDGVGGVDLALDTSSDNSAQWVGSSAGSTTRAVNVVAVSAGTNVVDYTFTDAMPDSTYHVLVDVDSGAVSRTISNRSANGFRITFGATYATVYVSVSHTGG